MTVFKGVFLFDFAEPAIGKWENQLGYRGMMEVWKHSITGDCIVIEPYEEGEAEDDWEVWVHDSDETGVGNWEPLAFGTEEEADKQAKQWMKRHPNGWKESK